MVEIRGRRTETGPLRKKSGTQQDRIVREHKRTRGIRRERDMNGVQGKKSSRSIRSLGRALPGQVVLVLQGGGALGSYQAGVYQALHEAGIEPDWIIGTSIGAINASLIAGNAPENRLSRLKQFWKRMEQRPIWSFRDVFPGFNEKLSYWSTVTNGIPGFFRPNPLAHAAKSQRNFTDPESRIMKSKDGFVQAYNAQAAVDAGAQIIVAHDLTQCGNDQGQLVPLIEAIENNLGCKPEQASADSGYCSESNLEALEAHGVDGYVAPGRAKHPTAANGKIGGPLTQRMRKKIDDGGFETPYRLRKQVVEPVFGQIKQARGFRQFLLRGVEKVRAEWAMICTAHN